MTTSFNDVPEQNPPAPALARRTPSPRSAPAVPGSGLSDLAVSPFGTPTALLSGEVRVAWVGRTSTEEQQDPRQSLIRQLERSKTALPDSWAIVCHFYDVESGRMELADRGRGTHYERFDIPIARDGGITDLLAEAAHPNRRFDAVICESTSRVARRMFENLSVERGLERAGVPLFAWNEPIKLDGGRAQQILQRRINQSVAEYEVFNALETSWGGLCTHVREGWNIGKPPYGYRAKHYRHPNPMKAERGATKSRLEPDGIRAETVTQIAHWRYYERLSYAAIVDRLNTEPEKYPPPIPPGGAAKARGAWSKSSVCEVLRAPKYTGYQVFNRRARRSRSGAHNDPVMWVWSSEPVHEPLIPKWMYDELAERRHAKRGSRDGNALNVHPETRRTYVLRGMLLHACDRRMFGKHRDGITYYSCQPQANNRGRPDAYEGHPKTVYLREDAILEAISAFLSDRVFGPERRELLAAELASVDDRAARQRETERDKLQHALDGLSTRQANILRQAETSSPDDPFTKGLRESYNRLESERGAALAGIARLDAADAAEPARPNAEDADLLDGLPYLALNLVHAPEQLLRRLFEVVQLTIRLHYDPEVATIQITLPADVLPDIAMTAERTQDSMPAIARPKVQRVTARTDAVGAPGRTRTCGQALRRRLLSHGGGS
ncbi:recombinase family protein [Streptomyces sp. NPDC088794]|uniref:recombinase family protein n=1 Tax=Streptomyces sp. NPDC088794 TaxID=3365902 RepID=UPI0038012A5F